MKKACCRSLVWLPLLCVSSCCFGQVITIRIINGKNGHPLSKQPATISLLYAKGEKAPVTGDFIMRSETDVNGGARFTLPDPPPAHLSVDARLTSEYWYCGCGLLVVTKELIQKGIVEGAAFSSANSPVTAEPGEVVFVVRPFTFIERLLYPLLKE